MTFLDFARSKFLATLASNIIKEGMMNKVDHYCSMGLCIRAVKGEKKGSSQSY